jgi:branched-chain amino acid transport system permease protein
VGLILERIAYYQFSGQPQAFVHNFGRRGMTLLGVQTSRSQIAIVIAGLTIVPLVATLSRRTRVGRQLTAVAQDPDGAASIGISMITASRIVMALSGVIAALTGFLAAPSLQVAPVALGLPLLFNGFVAAAIGGIGNLHGSLIGGLSLGLVLQFASAHVGANYLNGVLFGTLLVVYLIRPQGVLGDKALRTV